MSMFNIIRKEFQYGQHTVVLETGRVARQANTVVITMGGVQVLVAIVAQPKAKAGQCSARLTTSSRLHSTQINSASCSAIGCFCT
ncbi:MAG: hypothetical protein I4N51_06370 [Acinetobacter sp.]|nr:hypothetical protein [Acinetobacter sp.]